MGPPCRVCRRGSMANSREDISSTANPYTSSRSARRATGSWVSKSILTPRPPQTLPPLLPPRSSDRLRGLKSCMHHAAEETQYECNCVGGLLRRMRIGSNLSTVLCVCTLVGSENSSHLTVNVSKHDPSPVAVRALNILNVRCHSATSNLLTSPPSPTPHWISIRKLLSTHVDQKI